MSLRVALIGFGEVGVTLADDLAAQGATLSAWDLKFADAASRPSIALQTRSVRRADGAAHAVEGASLVISAVTAAETLTAAHECAAAIGPGTFFLDLNSASPDAKKRAAVDINGAGGRYVEAAVMAPIHPKRIATRVLLGGPYAESFLPVALDIGFSCAHVISGEYGVAAATKLCRSIIVKGVEALLTESMLTARHYGVEGSVLASLDDLFPGLDWPKLARYMMSRAIEHGPRRAEEMREAAKTVEQAALEPLLSDAIAARQDWAGKFGRALERQSLSDFLDAIREDMSSAELKR